ncbi:MAG TPA: hypothetical protein VL860_02570, partial [Planctomycetota bacterium]|nr:hypothetical protein [Planctomycetota bacterium]
MLMLGLVLSPATPAADAVGGTNTPATPAIADPASDPAKPENPADLRKAAEKTFTDVYGKDEAAALRSREAEDNLELAQKIAKDAADSKLDPLLAEVMRDHAGNLLTMLRTVVACDQAIQLREEEKNLPGADREAIQAKIVDLNSTAVKYMATAADQSAGEKRVLLALSELAEIQIHKRSFTDALKTLDRLRVALSRTDTNAAAQVSVRIRQLQPLTQREMRVSKLKKDWQA